MNVIVFKNNIQLTKACTLSIETILFLSLLIFKSFYFILPPLPIPNME